MVFAWRSIFPLVRPIGCLSSHAAIRLWWRRSSIREPNSCKVDSPCIQQCLRRTHGVAGLGCKIQQFGARGCQDARRVVETPSMLHDAGTPRQPHWRDRSSLCCRSVASNIALTPRPVRQQHRRSWRKLPGRVSGQPPWFEAEFGRKLHQPSGAKVRSDAPKRAAKLQRGPAESCKS